MPLAGASLQQARRYQGTQGAHGGDGVGVAASDLSASSRDRVAVVVGRGEGGHHLGHGLRLVWVRTARGRETAQWWGVNPGGANGLAAHLWTDLRPPRIRPASSGPQPRRHGRSSCRWQPTSSPLV
ncbi:RNaseH domain-containing protein [Streptomyces antioxidans]|uniref:RNaseH domain-containing protein n=1 Tax=Streptomyces antioxidans TaxID=1507734 RepID=UPI003B8383C0